MKAEVQLINEKGRGIPTRDRAHMKKYRGNLRIMEGRSQAFGRIVLMTDLLSATGDTEETLLPTLHDSSVIYLDKGLMRIRGFEVVEGVQFGQTWDIKVTKC